jgi:hypothetical protein
MVSNKPHGVPRVTVMHSLFRYSAGFGGTNALHGKMLGMLGETVGGKLPPLVQFRDDDAEIDFASALLLYRSPGNFAIHSRPRQEFYGGNTKPTRRSTPAGNNVYHERRHGIDPRSIAQGLQRAAAFDQVLPGSFKGSRG